MLNISLLDIFAFFLVINTAAALQCYRCVSTQPGCGKELSIRLQRWWSCPDPGPFGGENFCVKVIEQINSNTVITRECLMTMRYSERHREKLPTVQRQNYCQPGRNNDPAHPYDQTKVFCFCNDRDGCNTATRSHKIGSISVLLSGIAVFLFSRFQIL
jgi:hypothetical protein